MNVTEYKRKWFDERRSELHARGLKDAHIAEQMGIKRAYFSQLVNGLNVSDTVIDRMCASFSLTFPTVEQVANNQTAPPGYVLIKEEVLTDLASQVKLLTRAVNASLDQKTP